MKMIDILKDTMKARSALYGISAALLDEPDATRIAVYKALIHAFMETLTGDDDLREEFSESLAAMPDNFDIDELKLTHTKIFCMKSSVGKTASVYDTPDRLIKREPWTNVRAFYAKCGYQPTREDGLEDSMPMELAFMAQQSDSASVKTDIADIIESAKIQREFLNDHLSIWADDYFNDVIEAGSDSVYEGIARSMKSFIRYDTYLLENLVEG